MVFYFGASTIKMVLVAFLTELPLPLIICGAVFSSGRRGNSTKTGRFKSIIAEQFAGARINSSFHNRIKEKYL
jgi:hypothetical protein